MAERVIMPKAGMAMEEGTIVKWFKSEGDSVEQGEILLEILTDKVNMEVESLYSGTVLKIVKGEGEVVPVTETIAYIGEPGEEIDEEGETQITTSEDTISRAGEYSKAPMTAKVDRVAATPLAKTLARERGIDLHEVKPTGSRGQIVGRDVSDVVAPKATPLAKRIAQDRGIDLSQVVGSGHRGKVTRQDFNIEKADTDTSGAKVRKVPMEGMRKVIADRMLTSYQNVPHVVLNARARVDELMALRAKMNEALEERISYNDYILRAVAMAIEKHPFINVSVEGDTIVYRDKINIGMAVALEEGLIVPVITDAKGLSIREISATSKLLAAKAKEGRLLPDEYTGGTFTVSNLGMYGIISFSPIINPPESAILGVCSIEEELKMVEGNIQVCHFMGLSLSFDHRALDGAQGAIFLKSLIAFLENPYVLL